MKNSTLREIKVEEIKELKDTHLSKLKDLEGKFFRFKYKYCTPTNSDAYWWEYIKVLTVSEKQKDIYISKKGVMRTKFNGVHLGVDVIGNYYVSLIFNKITNILINKKTGIISGENDFSDVEEITEEECIRYIKNTEDLSTVKINDFFNLIGRK